MSDPSTVVQSESLKIRKLIPASRERVFSAWTDPQQLQLWWGPRDVRCLSAEIDLRVGGQYRIQNELPDGTILWIIGEFELIDPPRALIYTWTVATADPAAEKVSVRFERHELGTEVILTHEQISTTALRDQHQHGWEGCLDGLRGYLSTAPRQA